ncbi:MAG: hypothetical protein NXH74_12885, partial [Rhodobacteraceae bacterium]|nr:hypothetical protein [Paracoccaceae bacterium]
AGSHEGRNKHYQFTRMGDVHDIEVIGENGNIAGKLYDEIEARVRPLPVRRRSAKTKSGTSEG